MRNKNYLKLKRIAAITYVETVVYLGLFAMIFSSVMVYVFNIGDNNQIAEMRKDLEQNNMFIITHMNANFDKTLSIDDVNSVYTNSTGALRLNLNNSTYVQYNNASSRINFVNNGAASVYLTTPEVNVTNFYLEKVVSLNASTTGIRMTLGLQAVKNTNVTSTVTTLFEIR